MNRRLASLEAGCVVSAQSIIQFDLRDSLLAASTELGTPSLAPINISVRNTNLNDGQLQFKSTLATNPLTNAGPVYVDISQMNAVLSRGDQSLLSFSGALPPGSIIMVSAVQFSATFTTSSSLPTFPGLLQLDKLSLVDASHFKIEGNTVDVICTPTYQPTLQHHVRVFTLNSATTLQNGSTLEFTRNTVVVENNYVGGSQNASVVIWGTPSNQQDGILSVGSTSAFTLSSNTVTVWSISGGVAHSRAVLVDLSQGITLPGVNGTWTLSNNIVDLSSSCVDCTGCSDYGTGTSVLVSLGVGEDSGSTHMEGEIRIEASNQMGISGNNVTLKAEGAGAISELDGGVSGRTSILDMDYSSSSSSIVITETFNKSVAGCESSANNAAGCFKTGIIISSNMVHQRSRNAIGFNIGRGSVVLNRPTSGIFIQSNYFQLIAPSAISPKSDTSATVLLFSFYEGGSLDMYDGSSFLFMDNEVVLHNQPKVVSTACSTAMWRGTSGAILQLSFLTAPGTKYLGKDQMWWSRNTIRAFTNCTSNHTSSISNVTATTSSSSASASASVSIFQFTNQSDMFLSSNGSHFIFEKNIVTVAHEGMGGIASAYVFRFEQSRLELRYSADMFISDNTVNITTYFAEGGGGGSSIGEGRMVDSAFYSMTGCIGPNPSPYEISALLNGWMRIYGFYADFTITQGVVNIEHVPVPPQYLYRQVIGRSDWAPAQPTRTLSTNTHYTSVNLHLIHLNFTYHVDPSVYVPTSAVVSLYMYYAYLYITSVTLTITSEGIPAISGVSSSSSSSSSPTINIGTMRINTEFSLEQTGIWLSTSPMPTTTMRLVYMDYGSIRFTSNVVVLRTSTTLIGQEKSTLLLSTNSTTSSSPVVTTTAAVFNLRLHDVSSPPNASYYLIKDMLMMVRSSYLQSNLETISISARQYHGFGATFGPEGNTTTIFPLSIINAPYTQVGNVMASLCLITSSNEHDILRIGNETNTLTEDGIKTRKDVISRLVQVNDESDISFLRSVAGSHIEGIIERVSRPYYSDGGSGDVVLTGMMTTLFGLPRYTEPPTTTSTQNTTTTDLQPPSELPLFTFTTRGRIVFTQCYMNVVSRGLYNGSIGYAGNYTEEEDEEGGGGDAISMASALLFVPIGSSASALRRGRGDNTTNTSNFNISSSSAHRRIAPVASFATIHSAASYQNDIVRGELQYFVPILQLNYYARITFTSNALIIATETSLGSLTQSSLMTGVGIVADVRNQQCVELDRNTLQLTSTCLWASSPTSSNVSNSSRFMCQSRVLVFVGVVRLMADEVIIVPTLALQIGIYITGNTINISSGAARKSGYRSPYDEVDISLISPTVVLWDLSMVFKPVSTSVTNSIVSRGRVAKVPIFILNNKYYSRVTSTSRVPTSPGLLQQLPTNPTPEMNPIEVALNQFEVDGIIPPPSQMFAAAATRWAFMTLSGIVNITTTIVRVGYRLDCSGLPEAYRAPDTPAPDTLIRLQGNIVLHTCGDEDYATTLPPSSDLRGIDFSLCAAGLYSPHRPVESWYETYTSGFQTYNASQLTSSSPLIALVDIFGRGFTKTFLTTFVEVTNTTALIPSDLLDEYFTDATYNYTHAEDVLLHKPSIHWHNYLLMPVLLNLSGNVFDTSFNVSQASSQNAPTSSTPPLSTLLLIVDTTVHEIVTSSTNGTVPRHDRKETVLPPFMVINLTVPELQLPHKFNATTRPALYFAEAVSTHTAIFMKDNNITCNVLANSASDLNNQTALMPFVQVGPQIIFTRSIASDTDPTQILLNEPTITSHYDGADADESYTSSKGQFLGLYACDQLGTINGVYSGGMPQTSWSYGGSTDEVLSSPNTSNVLLYLDFNFTDPICFWNESQAYALPDIFCGPTTPTPTFSPTFTFEETTSQPKTLSEPHTLTPTHPLTLTAPHTLTEAMTLSQPHTLTPCPDEFANTLHFVEQELLQCTIAFVNMTLSSVDMNTTNTSILPPNATMSGNITTNDTRLFTTSQMDDSSTWLDNDTLPSYELAGMATEGLHNQPLNEIPSSPCAAINVFIPYRPDRGVVGGPTWGVEYVANRALRVEVDGLTQTTKTEIGESAIHMFRKSETVIDDEVTPSFSGGGGSGVSVINYAAHRLVRREVVLERKATMGSDESHITLRNDVTNSLSLADGWVMATATGRLHMTFSFARLFDPANDTEAAAAASRPSDPALAMTARFELPQAILHPPIPALNDTSRMGRCINPNISYTIPNPLIITVYFLRTPPTLPPTADPDYESATTGISIAGGIVSTSGAAFDMQMMAVFAFGSCSGSGSSNKNVRMLLPVAIDDTCTGGVQGSLLAIMGCIVLGIIATVTTKVVLQKQFLKKAKTSIVPLQPPGWSHAMAKIRFPSLIFILAHFLQTGLVVCGARLFMYVDTDKVDFAEESAPLDTGNTATTLPQEDEPIPFVQYIWGSVSMAVTVLIPVLMLLITWSIISRRSFALAPSKHLPLWLSHLILRRAELCGELHPLTRAYAYLVSRSRLPGHIWSIVPTGVQPLIAYLLIFATDETCAPFYAISGTLFLLLAATITYWQPHRVKIIDRFSAMALVLSAIMCFLSMGFHLDKESTVFPTAMSVILLIQMALSGIRILHSIFVTILLVGSRPPPCCDSNKEEKDAHKKMKASKYKKKGDEEAGEALQVIEAKKKATLAAGWVWVPQQRCNMSMQVGIPLSVEQQSKIASDATQESLLPSTTSTSNPHGGIATFEVEVDDVTPMWEYNAPCSYDRIQDIILKRNNFTIGKFVDKLDTDDVTQLSSKKREVDNLKDENEEDGELPEVVVSSSHHHQTSNNNPTKNGGGRFRGPGAAASTSDREGLDMLLEDDDDGNMGMDDDDLDLDFLENADNNNYDDGDGGGDDEEMTAYQGIQYVDDEEAEEADDDDLGYTHQAQFDDDEDDDPLQYNDDVDDDDDSLLGYADGAYNNDDSDDVEL